MHFKKQGMLVNEASLCAKVGGNGTLRQIPHCQNISSKVFWLQCQNKKENYL